MTFSRLMSQWQVVSGGPSTNRVTRRPTAPGGGSKPATAS